VNTECSAMTSSAKLGSLVLATFLAAPLEAEKHITTLLMRAHLESQVNSNCSIFMTFAVMCKIWRSILPFVNQLTTQQIVEFERSLYHLKRIPATHQLRELTEIVAEAMNASLFFFAGHQIEASEMINQQFHRMASISSENHNTFTLWVIAVTAQLQFFTKNSHFAESVELLHNLSTRFPLASTVLNDLLCQAVVPVDGNSSRFPKYLRTQWVIAPPLGELTTDLNSNSISALANCALNGQFNPDEFVSSFLDP